MSLSFPSIWVPGSSFILASCLIGKEAISCILLDQWSYSGELITKAWNSNISHRVIWFRNWWYVGKWLVRSGSGIIWKIGRSVVLIGTNITDASQNNYHAPILQAGQGHRLRLSIFFQPSLILVVGQLPTG